MVNVAHDRDNWWTRFQIFFQILFNLNGFHNLGTHILRLESEFIGNEVDGFSIEALIDGYHLTNAHTR